MSQPNIDQKAFEAEVERRINAWQAETLFPAAMIPGNFPSMVEACFAYNSAFDLRMTVEHYKDLTEKTEGYTYMDISEIGLVCKKRNRHELGLTKEGFNEFQIAVEDIVRYFLKSSHEQRDVISRKLVVTIQTEHSVPDNHKTIKFPAVQAQA